MIEEKTIEITITLRGGAVEYITALSECTGTPINEAVSAIVNGHRVTCPCGS
jgi:hypothetical protein